MAKNSGGSEIQSPISVATENWRPTIFEKKKENVQNPVANFSRRLYKKNKISADNIIC